MKAETGVKWLLRIISVTTIPAFIAAVIPQDKLVALLNWIDPELSAGLLVRYIMRCLMGLYAFMGIQALIWSTDVKRYRPLIMNLCVCAIIGCVAALTTLLISVPPAERTRVFWIAFIDITEGLAHILLLTILVLHVPTRENEVTRLRH